MFAYEKQAQNGISVLSVVQFSFAFFISRSIKLYIWIFSKILSNVIMSDKMMSMLAYIFSNFLTTGKSPQFSPIEQVLNITQPESFSQPAKTTLLYCAKRTEYSSLIFSIRFILKSDCSLYLY